LFLYQQILKAVAGGGVSFFFALFFFAI